jgi:hypothetical protein
MGMERLLSTDRGDLSLGAGGRGGTLQRCLSSRLAGREFRRSVDDLASHIAAARPPRILPILRHEQMGDHYFIHHQLDGEVRTAPQFFAQASLLERLQFAADALVLYEQWRQHLAAPVGMHAGRLVACRVAGHWLAHLAPCPRVPLASAYHLMQADLSVLAGIAPESVRGASAAGAPEDVYAAGTLVLLALGFRPALGLAPAESVEQQARAELLATRAAGDAGENALRQIPFALERLNHLEKTARRCAHFGPPARPADLQELRDACDQVLALAAPADCAAELAALGQVSDALRFLEWSFATGREDEESRRVAASLAESLQSPVKELEHIEAVVRYAPHDYQAARRRWRLRYEAFLSREPAAAPASESEGDWLLAELDRLRPLSYLSGGGESATSPKDDWLCIAMIHGRRGDLYARAGALYELTKLDFKDVESLLLYGFALREMADRKDAAEGYRDQVFASLHKLFDAVRERLDKLKDAGTLDEEEVEEWTARFQFLLLS